MIEDVVAALRALTDPGSGRPLIGEIWRADELYNGPFRRRAPDITFLPADMRNKALGTVDFTSNRFVERAYGNSGDHRLNGIFLMRGEGVRPGGRLEKARLLDAGPTILHYLGEGVPEDWDGRVLTEVFTEEELAQRPVRSVPVVRPTEGTGSGDGGELTPEELAEIRNRLKGIGYVG